MTNIDFNCSRENTSLMYKVGLCRFHSPNKIIALRSTKKAQIAPKNKSESKMRWNREILPMSNRRLGSIKVGDRLRGLEANSCFRHLCICRVRIEQFFRFLPHSKKTFFRSIEDFQLSVGVNVSVNACSPISTLQIDGNQNLGHTPHLAQSLKTKVCPQTKLFRRTITPLLIT